MSRALAFCGSEWKGQRALLLGYCALVFPSLMVGFTVVPDSFWHQQGNCAWVLACFVAAGVAGVVAFAAPQLVRGEFATGSDRFVRRLPGALAPSFAGKLLFLLLALASLPLLGLLVGELYLTAIGRPWHDLFEVRWATRTPVIVWPDLAGWTGWGLLLLPWVWATATWLPRGRMAVGATILLVLGVGLAVVAARDACDNLFCGHRPERWLWWLSPAGLLVAAVSWIRGRRGGGAPRSAAIGSLVACLALAPPAAWLGALLREYHHPDLQDLADLTVWGVAPDLRAAIATASSNSSWPGAPIRIDLATGDAEQIAGIRTSLRADPWPQLGPVQPLRYWWLEDASGSRLLDLTDGTRVPAECDAATGDRIVPSAWRARLLAEARATPQFRTPDGRDVWWDGKALSIERRDGTVATFAWPSRSHVGFLYQLGHGVVSFDNRSAFDLERECFVTLPPGGWGFCVRGTWFVHRAGTMTFDRFDPDSGESSPCPELTRTAFVGVLGGDDVLCSRWTDDGVRELFTFQIRDGHAEPFACSELGGALVLCNAIRVRDPADRLWLECHVWRPPSQRRCYVAIDRREHRVAAVVRGNLRLLAVERDHVLAQEEFSRVVRIDLATGARTVLFPRPARDR